MMCTPRDKNEKKKGKQNIDNFSMAINLSVCLPGVSFRGQIRHEICSNWFRLATNIPPVSDGIHSRLPRFQKMKSIFSHHCLEQQIHKQNPPATTDKAKFVYFVLASI